MSAIRYESLSQEDNATIDHGLASSRKGIFGIWLTLVPVIVALYFLFSKRVEYRPVPMWLIMLGFPLFTTLAVNKKIRQMREDRASGTKLVAELTDYQFVPGRRRDVLKFASDGERITLNTPVSGTRLSGPVRVEFLKQSKLVLKVEAKN